MRSLYPRAAMLALSGFLVGPAAQAQTITQDAWLNAQPKPAFRPGNTLPRLTRYAFALPEAAALKFCEDWGYALEFPISLDTSPTIPNITLSLQDRLDNPNSTEARFAALAKADPARYPLQVEVTKRMPTEAQAPTGSFAQDANGQILFAGPRTQPDGTPVNDNLVWSLEAPTATWELAGEYWAAGLRELQNRGIPVAYVLNGGEYGIKNWSQERIYWEQDPRYLAAVAQSPYGQGLDRSYASAKEGESEQVIAKAVKAASPQRSLYIPYTAGGRTDGAQSVFRRRRLR